jgi:hypothetical protein
MGIREYSKQAPQGPQKPNKTPEQKIQEKLKVDRTKLSVSDDPEQKQALRDHIKENTEKLRDKQSKRDG